MELGGISLVLVMTETWRTNIGYATFYGYCQIWNLTAKVRRYSQKRQTINTKISTAKRRSNMPWLTWHFEMPFGNPENIKPEKENDQ